MASKYTKKSKKALFIFRMLDFIILVFPILFYVIKALIDNEIGSFKKIGVLGACSVAIILTLLNIIAQKHLRSPIWIVFFGLYFAVENILLLVLMLAIGSILDEFIFTPLIKHYKVKVISNKTIDERIGA